MPSTTRGTPSSLARKTTLAEYGSVEARCWVETRSCGRRAQAQRHLSFCVGACTAWRACAVVEVRWFPKRGLWLSGCGERLTMRLRIFEALCLLPGSWSARCFRMHSVLRRLLEAKGLRFRRAFLPVAMQTGHDQSTFYSACTLHQKRTTGVFRCGLEQGPRTVSRPNPSAPASMRRDASSSALSLTRSGPGPNDWCDCCASLGT